MHQDEIIEEVWANRDRLAAQRNYDIRALYEDAKERERASNRRVAKMVPRRLARIGGQSANSGQCPPENDSP